MLKKLLVPAVGPIIYSHLQSKGYSAMKTVYLVRHAKSSWTDPRLPDKDRPLKGRGILDAVQMAESFRATLPKPDRIYSSPATRALHTAMLFAQTLGMALDDLVVVDRLYLAEADEVMAWLRTLPNEDQDIMVFGHNPATTDLVNLCVRERVENVPTAGLACLRFDLLYWNQLAYKARLVYYDSPKEKKP
jgi:phosphohistidine phosphatase